MPKRVKDKNKSIFVKFGENSTDKEIHNLLSSLGIYGVRVSTIVNRWAIEIPFWKEGYFVEKLSKNELVSVVHESFDRKRNSYAQDEQEDNDSE
jgi:hypothetical protein